MGARPSAVTGPPLQFAVGYLYWLLHTSEMLNWTMVPTGMYGVADDIIFSWRYTTTNLFLYFITKGAHFFYIISFTVGMNSQSKSRLIFIWMASWIDKLDGPLSNGMVSSISQYPNSSQYLYRMYG